MLKQNLSLKPYNTFSIEVFANKFIRFNNEFSLVELLKNAPLELPTLILGGGSNILFTKNYEGIVLKNELKGIEVVKEDEKYIYIQSAAGEVWHDLVMYCVDKNLQGLENLSLIPGTVGASPIQNIGAYGVELKDIFESLEALNLQTLEFETFDKTRCAFGYRDSIFKNEFKNKYIITSVIFKLNKQPIFNIKYGAIESQLYDMGINSLSVSAISNAVIAIRTQKLPNPKEIGNAGSFFKNPTIDASLFTILKTNFPDIVAYPTNLNFKIAAGWLIEHCGFKGYRDGEVGCHEKQALVIVNYGKATGKQIFDFSEKIIDKVFKTFNIKLEREVNIL